MTHLAKNFWLPRFFQKKKRKRDMLKNSYSLFFFFLTVETPTEKHLLGAFKIGLSHSANNNQISLSLQWAEGWPQQTTRAASVKKLTLISWHKEENPFFTFTDGGAKACWIYKGHRPKHPQELEWVIDVSMDNRRWFIYFDEFDFGLLWWWVCEFTHYTFGEFVIVLGLGKDWEKFLK